MALNSLASPLPRGPYAVAPPRAGRSRARYWGLVFSVSIAAAWLAGFALGFGRSATIVSIIGLVATVIGLAQPKIGIFGIGILCTLDAVTRVFVLTGGLLRWNTFNYVLLIAIMLNFPLLLKRRELPTRSLMLLVLFLGLNLLMMPDLSGGFQHILGAIAYFGLLTYFVRAARDDEIWQWVAIVCGVVGALAGLVFYIQFDSLPYINKGAWAFVPLTAIFIACLARTYQSGRKSISTLLWILVIANAVWVVLSGSRGAITMGASCLVYLLSGIPGISSRVMVLSAGVLMAGAITSHFTEQTEFAMQRFDKSLNSEISMSSRTSGRSDLAIGGWRVFLEHPLIGVGTGGYAQAWVNLGNRVGLSNYAADRASQAHSGWVKTLAEGGLLGVALLIGFVFSFFVVGYRSRNRSLMYLGLLVTVTFTVAFVSSEFQGKGLWFFAAGAAVVLDRESKRLRQKRHGHTLVVPGPT